MLTERIDKDILKPSYRGNTPKTFIKSTPGNQRAKPTLQSSHMMSATSENLHMLPNRRGNNADISAQLLSVRRHNDSHDDRGSVSRTSDEDPQRDSHQMTWQEALRTLHVALDTGLGIETPLSVLAESALQTLKVVQEHATKYEKKALPRQNEVENGSRNSDEIPGPENSSTTSPFPSWSVRARLKHNDNSRNYIRLPEHALTESHELQCPQHTELQTYPKASIAHDLPAFLQSRELSDALLLVSMEGGPRTVRRDATVLQCVLDILDVPSFRPTLGGIKTEQERLMDARKMDIAAIIDKHRSVLLSQEVITKMTRMEHKNGHWQGAMKLLQRTLLEEGRQQSSSGTASKIKLSATVPKTSPLITTGIEVFAAARQWELALQLMHTLPGALWQETEVSSVVKGLAKAKVADNWVHALKVLNDAVDVHKVPLSSPVSVNHLLGMLGRANRPEEATRVLEKFVGLSSSKDLTSINSGTPNYFAVNDNASPSSVPLTAIQQHQDDHTNHTKVEGNAHTITQICVAFRDQWQKALTYAGAIIARNKNNPRVVDGVALAKLTLICSDASLWREGLKVVELSEAAHTPMDPASYAAVAKLIAESGSQDQATHTAYVAACIRRHHSPDVFSRVLNTVIQSKSHQMAAIDEKNENGSFSTRRDADPTSPNSVGSPSSKNDDVEEKRLQILDMHYQTLMAHDSYVESASLQCLLEAYCRNGNWVKGLQFFNQLRSRGAITPAAHDAIQYAMLEPKAPLQPPKWDVAVQLYDEVTGCQTLAEGRISTSSDVGCQSSKTQNTIIGQQNNVVISEVAFRSCLRLCFSQGASDAAQRLLRTTMQRGIGIVKK